MLLGLDKMTPLEIPEDLVSKFNIISNLLMEATNELQLQMDRIEEILKLIGLGVPAWVPLDFSEYNRNEVEYKFGYSKFAGKWQLLISCRELDTGKLVQLWPLSESPRLARIQAAIQIPALFDALLLRANTTVELLVKRTEQVKNIVEIITAKLQEAKEDKIKRTNE